MPEDAIVALIDHARSAELRALPAAAVAAAKRSIVDTLAVAAGGAAAPGIPEVLAAARAWGGTPQATVLVYGDRLPAPVAALVNGAMGRSLDFDDCDEMTGDHPSVAAVPAALAAAQWIGERSSGPDVLAGVAVACDLVMRVRRASPLRLGSRMPWTTGTFAPLTACFAAARAARLDRDTFASAVGLAATELSNTVQTSVDASLGHHVHQGAAIQAGVAAVQLASFGLAGARNVLEGEFGLYAAYLHGDYDREALLADLGGRLLGEEISVKFYPCCKFTHSAIEAALAIRARRAAAAREIADVEVLVNRCAFELCARQPWTRPRSVVDGQFGLPFVVAAALLRGGVDLSAFDDGALQDPTLNHLAGLVRPVIEESLGEDGLQVGPSQVTVRYADGGVETARSDFVRGHPANPAPAAALVAKVHDCLSRVPGLPIDAADRLFALVDEFEHGGEPEQLLALLRPTAQAPNLLDPHVGERLAAVEEPGSALG
jgi:2-methylcitrate dehydratase PrpD